MDNLSLLQKIRYLLIDMDGVLYRGSLALPGAADFLAWLRRQGIGYLFLTNNSTRTPQQYVEKLAGIGIPAQPEQVFTSSLATRAYLQERLPQGAPLFFIGQRGLQEALFGDGYFIFDEQKPAAVVVGLDTQLTYDKLRRACLLIRAGALFVGTNPDKTFPSAEGITPGSGAILAALEAATGLQPTIIGKPEPWMTEEGMKRLGSTAENTAVLGDRLDTDILGARRIGLMSLLVLTGVEGPGDVEKSEVKPDAVFADLPALQEEWKKLLESSRLAAHS